MKAVSSAYRKSMESLIRNRSFAKITFANVDTTASTDGEWISDDEIYYSNLDTLDYEYDYGNTYVTLELNRWNLDGTQDIMPLENYKRDGYVSKFMSDESGIFAVPQALTRKFKEKHRLVGLSLSFGNRTGEWIKNLTIKFFLDGELLESQTHHVTGTVLELELKSEYIDEILIEFNNSLPYRRARLENILYGLSRIFDNDDISTLQQTSDVDPLSRRLPTETFTFSIFDYEHNYDPDNPSGIYSYIDTKSPISIQFGYELDDGTVEWIKADNYVLDSKPTIKNNVATFTATGLIGGLTDTYYKSKLGNKNFYDMAEDILLDANLPLDKTGNNPWKIDESLKEMYTTAVLPIDTHMNCLQRIAHACRCRLFTDDDNIIHIQPFGVTMRGIYKGDWSDNGSLWFSKWDSVDTGNIDTTPYAALELNRWSLDGNQNIFSESDYGFISDKISTADGGFTEIPLIAKTFEKLYDFPFLTLRFGSDYPIELNIKYYRNNILLEDKTIHNAQGQELSILSDVKDCNKIEIQFLEMLPNTRPRIQKVYYRNTDFSLDFTSISQNGQSISKIDELKAVSVEMYSYTAANETTLFEGAADDTNFHIEFNSIVDDVNIKATSGEILSSKVYGRAIDLNVSEGTVLLITGKNLSETATTTTIQINSTGETDIEKNTLITNAEMRNALSEYVIKYLTMRNTYDSEYRGNPELEPGDIIGLQTGFTGEINTLILVDELKFNGSLSGKLKMKGLL